MFSTNNNNNKNVLTLIAFIGDTGSITVGE